jgi:hypothetical protein
LLLPCIKALIENPGVIELEGNRDYLVDTIALHDAIGVLAPAVFVHPIFLY